jgi:hypothetical protein
MLSSDEKLNLQDQLKRVESQIAAESTSREGLLRGKAEAAKDENFFKKKFDYSHTIITRYEREIECMTGDYIAQPFGEQDVQNQANEIGRLYQGLVSTEPKRIPEMLGQGLSTSKMAVYELLEIANCLHIIETLTNGEAPYVSTSTTLQEPYVAGSGTFISNGSISPNNWYLLGGTTLVYAGSVTYSPPIAGGGSCSISGHGDEASCTLAGGTWSPSPPVAEFWSATIAQRYFLTGFDNAVLGGGSISTFTGYTNTERTNKVASSTAQSMFDQFTNVLAEYITNLLGNVNEELIALNKNEDPALNLVHKSITEGFKDFLVSYLATLPLQDGVGGIDGLKSYLETRQAWIPTRVSTCMTAKANFYADRIGNTVTRCDIQSGTLTRVKFLEILGAMYPETGNPSLLSKRDAIKKALNE